MIRTFYQRFVYAAFIAGIVVLIVTGCSSDSSKKSPTTPQNGINATGTWNLTYTVQTTSCDYGGEPGMVNNMTLTLLQDGSQLSSPEYPGSSGTINPTTGQFILTQNALAFEITLDGVTDGTTCNGIYTLKTVRLDSGAACEIVYDFTGIKISASTKPAQAQ